MGRIIQQHIISMQLLLMLALSYVIRLEREVFQYSENVSTKLEFFLSIFLIFDKQAAELQSDAK